MTYCYYYPRPALGVDVLAFSKIEDEVFILLIERGREPYANHWAFPGGFVEEGESCEEAALRELHEETGLQIFDIEQVYTASTPGRDPRGWIVTVAFTAWLDKDKIQARSGDDAKNVGWFSIKNLPPLAFDHEQILHIALTKLRLHTI